jgi:hypothetical protein
MLNRAPHTTLLRYIVLWLAAAFASVPLQAQPTCGRCLNGFRFLPSSVVGSPFASTYFDNATGGGLAVDLEVPVRDLEGQVVDSLSGDIGFFLLDFEYQRAIASWLALRGGVSAVARVGTSTEAIVASGLSAVYSGSLGATVPVWRSRPFLISLVADLRRTTQYLVDPFRFAQQLVDSGYSASAKQLLLSDELSNHWSAGLRAAWAPQSWVGLNVVIESGRIDDPESGDEPLTQVGAQLAFDVARIWDVPLGMAIGYRENTGAGRRGELSGSYRVMELGVFYTGHREFQIGADVFWSRVAVERNAVPDLDAVQFRLVTRLDF